MFLLLKSFFADTKLCGHFILCQMAELVSCLDAIDVPAFKAILIFFDFRYSKTNPVIYASPAPIVFLGMIFGAGQ